MKTFEDVNELENFVKELLIQFKKECSTIFKNPHDIAYFIIPKIREKYNIKKRELSKNYIFLKKVKDYLAVKVVVMNLVLVEHHV